MRAQMCVEPASCANLLTQKQMDKLLDTAQFPLSGRAGRTLIAKGFVKKGGLCRPPKVEEMTPPPICMKSF